VLDDVILLDTSDNASPDRHSPSTPPDHGCWAAPIEPGGMSVYLRDNADGHLRTTADHRGR
jgi:hypothetical protein